MRSSYRPSSRTLEDDLEALRRSECPVLIQGETGTGKSRLARRIHAGSARAAGPLIEVSCAGLTPELVQSQLFAPESRGGLLEAAHGGTLVMDAFGDMDPRVQPMLLEVIEERRFRRAGDLRERIVDVRFLAATHTSLLDAVERKAFRRDLYDRISTMTLVLPALRQRKDELVTIATTLLRQIGGTENLVLSSSAAAVLLEYPWPGNLRELKNVIERAAVCRRSNEIGPEDLRFDSQRGAARSITPPPNSRVLGSSPSLAKRTVG